MLIPAILGDPRVASRTALELSSPLKLVLELLQVEDMWLVNGICDSRWLVRGSGMTGQKRWLKRECRLYPFRNGGAETVGLFLLSFDCAVIDLAQNTNDETPLTGAQPHCPILDALVLHLLGCRFRLN